DADRRKRHLGDFLVTCERRVIQVHIVDADCHGERRFPEHVSPHVESKFYSWVIGSAVNKATPNHLRCCRYFDCLLPVLLIRRARLPYFWPYHRGFIRPNLERYVVGVTVLDHDLTVPYLCVPIVGTAVLYSEAGCPVFHNQLTICWRRER